ncbi:PREDICTED: uncharacterized protein LOC103333454 [Prunus mume]|uniref:Uncharacterized protein LOC103333454 n=1 Tax=Prunus mume TaxID=102107 RepID=A0ABM1LQY2_PRUMU|nr:PREDICTED: uncharacterized protein LOC103333454 [Prunus mume]
MERPNAYVKKGPWTAEEDEIDANDTKNVNFTTKWKQVFSRGREDGDTTASTIREQVGENRNVPSYPCSSAIEEGTSCCNYETHNCFSNSQEFRMVPLPDLVKPNLQNVEAEQPIFEATPLHMISPIDSPPHYSLSQLPQPQLDLPFLSECKELDQDPMAPDLLDMFGLTECESGQKFFKENTASTKLGEVKDLSIPNIVFDDFPPEMLDYLETLTSSSEL